MKQVLRLLKWIVGAYIVYIISVLIYGSLTDFQPVSKNALTIDQSSQQEVLEDSIFSLAIWNIGYSGLGEESDFFFDDGNMFVSGSGMIRPSKEISEKNFAGIQQLVKANQTDFWLLQEVDLASKRSYFFDQYSALQSDLTGWAATYAVNYRSGRVPLPILEPWHVYGAVESGIATFSKYQYQSAVRYQLPGNYPWPTRIFQLDRGAAVHRIATISGKDLYLINIHNSAYDKGGVLKAQQMAFLKDLMTKAYQEGHYVIAGGDWNQCPPNFPYNRFNPNMTSDAPPINIEADFMPEGWLWAYDPTLPTNRSVGDVYQKEETFTTILDFFLVSPNVKVLNVKTIDHQFQFSDHQPVWIEVEI